MDLVEERGDVAFRWVKGHSGHPMNDLVDRLAVEASHSRLTTGGSPVIYRFLATKSGHWLQVRVNCPAGATPASRTRDRTTA